MKVQGPPRPNVSQIQDKATVKNTESAKPAKNTGERVAVSSLSKALSEARSAPESVDTQKVHSLRESIRTGEFRVDHEKVADTMVREEA
jgi:flagellar biosynthesis anti-sigma factor FlgM